MKKVLLLVFCVLSSLCNAQYLIDECINEDVLPTNTHNRDDITYDSRYGCDFSPNGTLRVLLIFAEIEYDLHPNMDPKPNGTTAWPKGEYPIWCDQLFDNEIINNQCCGSVTKYYREASFDNYTILGDYLIKGNNNNSIFKIKESDGYTYTAATGNIAETILFNKINQEMTTGPITAHGYNSISYFDNWTKTGYGEVKITPSIDNPRKFDCIVVIWRNRIKNEKIMNNTGYVGSTNMDLFGYGVDFCINVGTLERIPTTIIRHEYAHGLLGSNNFHTAGGGKQLDYLIPFIGGWGMLGLSGSSLQCCNGWDRQRLGWKSAYNTYDISARAADGITEVNGDIDINTCNGIYVLRDFMTTGDALRIKLPFIDEEKEYPEWIWLENHAGRHYNNSMFDVWHYELDYDCIDSFPGGLMAYIQIDKNIRVSDDYLDVYGGFGGYTRPLAANGFYERSYESNPTFNYCVQWEETHAFIKNQPNPLTGGGDEEKYAYNCNNDEVLTYDDQMNNFVEKIGNNYHYHLYAMGKNSHIFKLDSINKIGISTNPSTATMVNMVSYEVPYLDNKNVRANYLNGISIEIIEENTANGTIKVKIRFDDVDINNDVRWCSDSIVLNEIPTSSGYSLHIKPNKTITLDQGLTATRMTNPMTFNEQKIFASPTTFTIQPDVRILIDTAASIVLENSSKLHFREGSECTIDSLGSIVVKSGTVFQMDDCSTLIIRGTGKLIVEDSAILRISNHAFFDFAKGTQNIQLGNNVIIPEGYANPLALLTPSIGNTQINGLTVWEGCNMVVNGTITVNSGATLRVKSSFLRFKNENSGIIVDRGGRLVIDNSTLTTLCHNSDYMWKGIEVWGNRYDHQYEINGVYLQGYLELKNGATIENAVCAVELGSPYSRVNMGGIIHATNAVFRNNALAVRVRSYTNYQPWNGGEADYNSRFFDCTFTINDEYSGLETFQKHVDLSYINGIVFRGCEFSVVPNTSGVSADCMGIYADNAGFKVQSYCTDSYILPCPDYNLKPCTFENFKYAIFSSSSGVNARTFLVENAIFTSNTIGIFANNTGFATIVGNEFHILNTINNNTCSYGIYANSVTDFSIEENLFINEADYSNSGIYGIGVFNSGSVNDIYLNTFRNLTCGNISYGINYIDTGTTYLGLTYTCNDNAYNIIDFCVLKNNDIGGIQGNQGSLILPAGNTFSKNYYDFYNDGDFYVNYYYNTNNQDETPDGHKLMNVTPCPRVYSNDCASHNSGNGGVLKTAGEISALAANYQEADEIYSTIKRIYESRIDGGSTATMVYDIDNATSSDMWNLRSRLLGNSPYVSTEVLTRAIDRDDVFSQSVLFEILSANPDELKHDTLINYIESKGNRLPDYMIGLLRQMASGTTARTALVSQMTKYAHDRNLAASDIVRSYLNDSIVNYEGLRLWLGNMNNINADRLAVSLYMQEGDYANALLLASTMPVVYGLQGNDLSDHNDYMTLLNLYQTLYNSNRTIQDLTDTEISIVTDIADNGFGESKVMAGIILMETGNRDNEPYICPDTPYNTTRDIHINSMHDITEQTNFVVNISPNPATTWVTIDYQLPFNSSSAHISFVNSYGLTVMDVELFGNTGTKTIDLRNLANGVYSCIVRCNESVNTSKLVITK